MRDCLKAFGLSVHVNSQKIAASYYCFVKAIDRISYGFTSVVNLRGMLATKGNRRFNICFMFSWAVISL